MHQPDVTQNRLTGIGQLEQQVEVLIKTCIQLREENASMRQRQEALVAEKADLIEKTELARTRV